MMSDDPEEPCMDGSDDLNDDVVDDDEDTDTDPTPVTLSGDSPGVSTSSAPHTWSRELSQIM